MKVYGHPGCNGIGFYSRELARVLDCEWLDILPHLSSGRRYDDGIMVMGCNGPFGFASAAASVLFWEFVFCPEIPKHAGTRIAASRFLHSIFGGVVLPIIATESKLKSEPNPEFTVLYSFDADSSVFRKNPYALIEACRRMSPSPKLVIKTTIPRPPDVNEEWITWIGERLGQDEYDDLWRKSTVYVSSHRSEGLGMTIVEAMSKGRPVIATGYGGCCEFLESSFADLVPYSWIRIPRNNHHSYDVMSGLSIPDPSIDSLAYLLNVARDDRNMVLRKAQNALVKHSQMVREWQENTPKIISLILN